MWDCPFEVFKKSMKLSETYLKKIKSSSSEANWKWFDRIYDNLGSNFNPNRFAAAYSGVRRRLGNLEVTVPSSNEDICFDSQLTSAYQITLDELGRACLLLRAIECLTQEESTALIRDTYEGGDNYEKQALLQTLPGFT